MKSKRNIVLILIGIIILIVVAVGGTYAFFTFSNGTTANANITVTTHTTDDLDLDAGNDIVVSIDQDNFGKSQVGTNPSGTIGSSTGTATFTANDKRSSDACYNVYLNINRNTFEYTDTNITANPHLPELALSVSKNGTPIFTDLDITVATGKIKIPVSSGNLNNFKHTLTASAGETVTDTYTFTIRAVNQNWNQNALSIKNATFEGAIVYSECEDSLAEYIIANAGTEGTGGLYYHDGVGTYSTYEAGDNSYRYSGTDVNNYVCLNDNNATCNANNLYRIIGVFGSEVKVIKNTPYGELAWDDEGGIIWIESSLKSTLNSTYLATLSAIDDKISDHSWSYRTSSNGSEWSEILQASGVKAAYEAELTNNERIAITNAKIGLPYVSDLMYARSADDWDEDGLTQVNSWAYFDTVTNRGEATITIGNIDSIISFSNRGFFTTTDNNFSVRPTFYLNSDAIYKSGDGSSSTPYRIK